MLPTFCNMAINGGEGLLHKYLGGTPAIDSWPRINQQQHQPAWWVNNTALAETADKSW